jgi:Tfp pilus assembly protein PilX
MRIRFARHSNKPQNRVVNPEKGIALLLSLLLLVVFGVLGVGLLTVANIETTIADNYKINTQVLYVAEAGIDHARETLRASANTLTQNLTTAAGGDAVLSTSRDLATLTSADVPFVTNAAFTDLSGRNQGQYTVFIKNDAADGPTSPTDNNDTVTLLSFGRFRNAIKIVETDVRRGAIPELPAALTLDGPLANFDSSGSNIFDIDGNDGGTPPGPQQSAVGVISPADDTTVTNDILGPPDRSANYVGSGGSPSVNDVEAVLAPELVTTAGLEQVVADIASYATATYNPAFNGSQSLGNVGAANNQQVVVVNGDCVFGPGAGYGTLVVRGNLTFNGNFTWNGLILVIGQGVMNWNGGAQGEILGAMLVAASRGMPRTSTDPVGPVLANRGPIVANFNGGGGNGIHYNTQALRDANRGLPYRRISYRLY